VAKLTLSFKDRKLKVFALQPGICLIGRDPECAIVIDSLAVEPQHARIRADGEHFVVEAVSPDNEVRVNQQAIGQAHRLGAGDLIQVGKHRLSFSEDSGGTVLEPGHQQPTPVAWLQIQNGAHLGRTIRLDKAFTRVGKPDSDLAVIAHRDDGYFLSALQGERSPEINDQVLGDVSRRLAHGDRILIGELQVQFIDDNEAAHSAERTASAAPSGEQRRFSRIPFDMRATLQDGAQTWQTSLLDISLHGALIRTPGEFEATPARAYQLAVHLEGGPDIVMDVAIAHQEQDEIGLKCNDIDVDSITHLRRLVELNLGDPELLERELSALGN